MRHHRQFLTLAVLAWLPCQLMSATATWAQDAPASAGMSRADNQNIIEEVIVSATKRDTGLQDTGIAISVLSDDEMAFRDMGDLQDMQNSVPGLHVGAIMGTPIINIRGIGLNLMTGMGTPGVATHYDGVYIPRNGSTTTATVDLGQVEVLRGPQGTLYGRNATGGSINFIGKQPASEFGWGVSAGGGGYEREFYEGFVEGPLGTDRVTGRLFFKTDQFAGYGINEANGTEVGNNNADMLRAALVYDITDSLTLYASHSRRKDEGRYPYQSALNVPNTLAGEPVDPETMSFTPRNTKLAIKPVADSSTEISHVTLTWDFAENYTFKSITGHVKHDRYEFYSPVDSTHFIAYLERPEYAEAWSQEFNLSGAWFDDQFNWLLGLYWGEDDGASPLNAFINADGFFALQSLFPTGSYIYMDPTAATIDTAKAIFIDGYWSIVDSLRMVFGIRYSEDEQEFNQTFMPDFRDAEGNEIEGSSTFVGQLPLFAETCEDLTSHFATDSTDPKFGLEWDATEDIMLYAQYQTGYKSGGFDITVSCTASFEPEEIESIEDGLKSSLFDCMLTINFAAFDYQYTNFQVQQVEGFGSKIENAPEASSRGAEMELSWLPTSWFALDAQYSYLDTEYKEFSSRDGYKNSSTASNDAPLEDLSGNELSRAPRHSVNLGATFFAPLQRFGLGMAQLRLEAYYADEHYFREFNAPEEHQDDYTLYNVYLSLTAIDDRVRLNLFGKNLTDEDYMVGQLPMDIVKYRGGYYAPPKTYGASLTFTW